MAVYAPAETKAAASVASASASATPDAPASLDLDELSLAQLEEGAKEAGWKVTSDSELAREKTFRHLTVILEERDHDGYVTLLDFTGGPTKAAAAKVGAERALLVRLDDSTDDPKAPTAERLLQSLLAGSHVDEATRETLQAAAKGSGWKVEYSQTGDEKYLGYDEIELDLAGADELEAHVVLFDYGASVKSARAVVDGTRVLLVSVPGKQSMSKPILKRIGEVAGR